MHDQTDWTTPQSHDPNPIPPDSNLDILIEGGDTVTRVTPEELSRMPQQAVSKCFIVSTGHGTSGPFTFAGVALRILLEKYAPEVWNFVDVISADGFRTRISRGEIETEVERPPILALSVDGRPMNRGDGLVRLIVPSEQEDALRQIKWVSNIRTGD